MMCACRSCWVMTLAGGLLVSALAGFANAEKKKIPNRMAVTEDVRSGVALDSAIPDPEMTLRGGGSCDSPALCDGDVNADGVVDPLDGGAILARFGLDPCAEGLCQYDVNCDGTIDPLDGGYVLARFGVCNPPIGCQTPGCGPLNDNCDDAIEAFDGDTPFSNVGATRDGPDDCPDDGTGDFNTGQADIWYHYTVTRTGRLVISLCDDTDYDSTLSVYNTTDCPVGAEIGCSDDDCGQGGGPSELLLLTMIEGNTITIRVGGWSDGEPEAEPEGSGTLTIKNSGGPCCFGHDLPGCDSIDDGSDPAEVEACVCALDDFCCNVVWDSTCASFVETFGCGDCPDPCNCCDDLTGEPDPGCDDPVCEALICNADPFCCDFTWDVFCADAANECCSCCPDGDPSDPDCAPAEACGEPDAGDCCEGNGSPGCDVEACCLTICPQSPECCEVEWTQTCADEAAAAGGPCDFCVP